MVCGPVVSPACGTLCRPAARARSNTGLNCGRSTPTSGPPSPKPISDSGALSRAYVAVASAAGSPNSPGMSNTQRSVMPSSLSADVRASSTASTYASIGTPASTDVYGVNVISA